jgi:hypothetical protein
MSVHGSACPDLMHNVASNRPELSFAAGKMALKLTRGADERAGAVNGFAADPVLLRR